MSYDEVLIIIIHTEAYVFYEYSCRHMCICANVPACANIPPQPRRAPAAECPDAPAGRGLGWPAAARGWCRPNQWSPLSAPPVPPAGCPRSGATGRAGSPAGTPRCTAGEKRRSGEYGVIEGASEGLLRKKKEGGHSRKFYSVMFWGEKTQYTIS